MSDTTKAPLTQREPALLHAAAAVAVYVVAVQAALLALPDNIRNLHLVQIIGVVVGVLVPLLQALATRAVVSSPATTAALTDAAVAADEQIGGV